MPTSQTLVLKVTSNIFALSTMTATWDGELNRKRHSNIWVCSIYDMKICICQTTKEQIQEIKDSSKHPYLQISSRNLMPELAERNALRTQNNSKQHSYHFNILAKILTHKDIRAALLEFEGRFLTKLQMVSTTLQWTERRTEYLHSNKKYSHERGRPTKQIQERNDNSNKKKKPSKLHNYHTLFSNVLVMPVSWTRNKLPISIKAKQTAYI